MYHVLLWQACTFLGKTLRRHSTSAVAAQTTCPPMFLPSGVTFPLRASGGAMVDVDSIKGCAVQSETVFHCSEASQSTTKVTKHSAATAGQLPSGTGREFLVDHRRIFGTSNQGNFTDMFLHSVAFNRKFRS